MGVDIVFEMAAATTDDEAGVATGWLPGRLSERGRRYARELGRRRRADGLNAIFCSDLAHAVETVQLAFPFRELPVRWDTRLRQCNYGVLNGRPLTEVAERRPRHLDVPFPGGQSYREVVEQARGFLRDLAGAWDGARVLVVAHSANRWALEHLLNGADLADLLRSPDRWQPGWCYRLPSDWDRRQSRPARSQPGHPTDRPG
jgi:broad specificity phosphatase PhoE